MSEEVNKNQSSTQIDFGEYFNMLFDAAQYVWKNKIIWLIAIIGVMFGLSSSYQTSSSFNYNFNNTSFNNYLEDSNFQEYDINTYDSNSTKRTTPLQSTDDNIEKLTEFWEENMLPMIGIIIVCGLIWLFVGIVIRTGIRGALIKAGDFEQQKLTVSFKIMWEATQKLFLQSLMIGAIALIVYIIFVFASIPLCLCICIGWIIYLLLGILLSILQGFSYRYVLLQDKEFLESISLTWNLIKEKINDFILFYVANILIGIGYLIAVIIVIGIPSIILIFLGITLSTTLSDNTNPIFVSFIPTLISILIVVGFILVVGGFGLATNEIYFTKFFYRVTGLKPLEKKS